MTNAPYESPTIDKDKNIFTLPWRMWLSSLTSAVGANTGLNGYYTPISGFSYAASSTLSRLILTPAGVLATGTVTMPAAPVDNAQWNLSSTNTITALTLSPAAGQTILNAPATLTAGVGVGYTYSASNATWYRLY